MADNKLRWIYQWIYDDIITERYLTYTIHIIPTVTYIQSIQGYTFSSHATWIPYWRCERKWHGSAHYRAEICNCKSRRWVQTMLHLQSILRSCITFALCSSKWLYVFCFNSICLQTPFINHNAAELIVCWSFWVLLPAPHQNFTFLQRQICVCIVLCSARLSADIKQFHCVLLTSSALTIKPTVPN